MEEYTLNVRESSRVININASDVKIEEEGIKKAAKLLFDAVINNKLVETMWSQQAVHAKVANNQEKAVDWCMVIDCLNFSFWPSKLGEHFEVSWNGKKWTGYYALCACFNKEMERNPKIIDPNYYKDIPEEELRRILTSDNGDIIPLFNERLQILRETGAVLFNIFNGHIINLVEKCNRSAKTFINALLEHFSSFRDVSIYRNVYKVKFLKRAQILAADINGALGGDYFNDMDELTMFADYRVPQSLHYLGVLTYSHALMAALNSQSDKYINLGDRGVDERMEHEIRGCSILACDKIVESTNLLLAEYGANKKVNASAVDYFLWCYRRQNAKDIEASVPFHRVRTIFY